MTPLGDCALAGFRWGWCRERQSALECKDAISHLGTRLEVDVNGYTVSG